MHQTPLRSMVEEAAEAMALAHHVSCQHVAPPATQPVSVSQPRKEQLGLVALDTEAHLVQGTHWEAILKRFACHTCVARRRAEPGAGATLLASWRAACKRCLRRRCALHSGRSVACSQTQLLIACAASEGSAAVSVLTAACEVGPSFTLGLRRLA